jgi:GntR family transcriptional regulator
MTPLYLQIEEELRGLILSGQLGELSRAPSEWELSERFQVSRMTARKAVDRLVSDGMLVRRPGKGTFVARRRIAHGASQQLSFSAAMRELDLPLVTRVLDVQEFSAPRNVSQALELDSGAKVVLVRRLRIVAGEPVAIHTAYFGEHFSYLLEADLTGSLTDIMASHGDRVVYANDFIEAVVGTGDEARLLNIPNHSPLVRIEGVALSAGHQVLRYSEGLYRADRFRFASDTASNQKMVVELRNAGETFPPRDAPGRKTSKPGDDVP